jgi:superfamily II DNA helicase RecQ
MQIRIFSIPVFDSETETGELNRFLRAHKIIDIEKQFVQASNPPFWSFCIRYIDMAVPVENQKKPKVDYKDILDEATFKIFSDLRIYRKQIAERDGVPAYAVFTNEELAEIAKLEEITTSKLQTIKGIGEQKARKYGAELIELYRNEEGG